MDPSLSSDPHRPQQYSPFPQYPPSNSPFVSAPNLPFYGVNQTPFNTHVSPPQPQTQTQTQTPPPYSELIVEAIAHLNEPEGSSKMAISRYIERSNPVLPTDHQALLAHHLKTLKNCGVLSMVKKSYKLAASSSAPESVAVAAAAAAAGLAPPPPRSESPLDPAPLSASQPQKRGRGRPPKPKPEASPQQQQQQLIIAQPNAVQLNGQPSWEQPQFPVASPTQVGTESAKRGPGRPRKDGSAPIPRPAGMSVIMKRRGRPPGRRAAGRQRKPLSVSSTASVFPYVANGARRRGRPRRVDSGGVPVAAPAGGEAVAVAPGIKRGRGRPPKIGGVKNRLITKPKRGRGRPVGRPRKNPWPVTVATGALESAYGELKAKLDLYNEKAKEILNVLNTGITSNDNQAAVEAAQKLEGLISMMTVEPQAVEEAQPEEAATQTEAEEPQEGEGHGQEREGEEDQAPTDQTQVQTDAEAMQEALF
ncbi:unnamed protein product [Brassica rapa]|uniref:H15 domain-containing protein n=1 Tax=Brassica campestris TaxID=3711 RepID=A0A3P5ZP11_BRACM|nr:unnamed protein product [Brassica rapa]VDC77204.1 unnamed protein product [Brassica rapa]